MSPLEAVRGAFQSLTAFREDDLWAVDAVAIIFAGLNWQALPKRLWLYLIGPSGIGKNVLLHGFSKLDQYLKTSSVTANALISAYDPQEQGKNRPEEEDPSALREWNNKVVVFEDFTTQLNKGLHSVEELLGQLRDVYDGRLVKSSGTVGTLSITSNFGLVISCTEVLDRFNENSTQMGERFFSIRLGRRLSNSLRDRSTHSREVTTIGRTQHIWERQLALSVYQNMLLGISGLPDITSLPCPPEDQFNTLTGLANAVMALKSRPINNVYQEPASGSRLSNVFLMAANTRAALDSRTTLNSSDLYLIRRAAWDMLDGPTARLASTLWTQTQHKPTVSELATAAGCPQRPASSILNQWAFIGLVDKDSTGHYKFSTDARAFLQEVGLFEGALSGPQADPSSNGHARTN